MLRLLYLSLLLITVSTALNSCYRMPTDDDYSLVPSTNNPDRTRQRQESLMPKVSY
ncbi:MAG: hypothetical protein H0T62_12135 [Parachlamydiaceae bacterium]|nr:hypothetical protein [Parachlamydiaceae bacterium]